LNILNFDPGDRAGEESADGAEGGCGYSYSFQLPAAMAQWKRPLQALIRIVEDLHSSCTQAGLPATDRASIVWAPSNA